MPDPREPYDRPVLKELGQVSALTQSGSEGGAEMVDAMGNVMGIMAEMMSRL